MSHADTIRGYFDAVNHEDWGSLERVFHPDATFQTPGAAPRVGRAEIIELFRRLFDAWSKHLDDPIRVVSEGDLAAVEVEFTGTSTGGRDITFGAVDMFSFQDAQVIGLRSYYDLLAVRQELNAQATETPT